MGLVDEKEIWNVATNTGLLPPPRSSQRVADRLGDPRPQRALPPRLLPLLLLLLRRVLHGYHPGHLCVTEESEVGLRETSTAVAQRIAQLKDKNVLHNHTWGLICPFPPISGLQCMNDP